MGDYMSQDNEHIKSLASLRNELVQGRREAAELQDSIRVARLQEQIEVIDRAIIDERKLSGGPYLTVQNG